MTIEVKHDKNEFVPTNYAILAEFIQTNVKLQEQEIDYAHVKLCRANNGMWVVKIKSKRIIDVNLEYGEKHQDEYEANGLRWMLKIKGVKPTRLKRMHQPPFELTNEPLTEALSSFDEVKSEINNETYQAINNFLDGIKNENRSAVVLLKTGLRLPEKVSVEGIDILISKLNRK